jgi:hypothetical protein
MISVSIVAVNSAKVSSPEEADQDLLFISLWNDLTVKIRRITSLNGLQGQMAASRALPNDVEVVVTDYYYSEDYSNPIGFTDKSTMQNPSLSVIVI